LLTLSGWTSPRIAEAFGVRDNTVRLWRSDFAHAGVEALETSPASGPAPVKAEAALRAVVPLLEAPVAVTISKSRLSKVLRKKFRWRRPRHTPKGRQDADAIDRVGLRLALRKAQSEAGDIVLLFADESEALTHPYLARARAKRGADLRVPAPGQARPRRSR
jgi:transposase